MATMQPIDVTKGPAGETIIRTGPPRVGFSAGLIARCLAEPGPLTVEGGELVLRGVDPDGAAVELRYRPVDFNAGQAVDEGGFLLCDRVDVAPVVVHVAGTPGPDHIQRCVSCGAELIDNSAAMTLDSDERGPGWWGVGNLVAVDKPSGVRGPGVSYMVAALTDLGVRERPCTPTGG